MRTHAHMHRCRSRDLGCACAFGVRACVDARRFVRAFLYPSIYLSIHLSIYQDLMLASISGGTDICSCFALGNPLLPVRQGELQVAGLGAGQPSCRPRL